MSYIASLTAQPLYEDIEPFIQIVNFESDLSIFADGLLSERV